MHVCRRLVLIAVVVAAGTLAASAQEGFTSVRDGRIVDAAGRHVVLRGIAVGFACPNESGDDPSVTWPHGGAETFAAIRSWGFNCVRIPIYWSAIEPEPGVYDDAFLAQLDEKIAWAKENDLGVILDMHQDFWGIGVPNGRGAPAWALLDPELQHKVEGPEWVTCFRSARLKAAYDSFWKNSSGPGEVGLQDRFAAMWGHVAARYADEPAIAGYEVLNDPFPGSPLFAFLFGMISRMTERLEAKGQSIADLSLFERGEPAWVEAHTDPESYAYWMEGGAEIEQGFDEQFLAPFYARVVTAIRTSDANHPIFLSGSTLANLGVTAPLAAADPLQVYAPKALDSDGERLALRMNQFNDTATGMKAPLVVTEWGHLSNSDEMFEDDPVAGAPALLDAADASLAGLVYWQYEAGLADAAYFGDLLQRPYPMAAAGAIIKCAFDAGMFECVWREDGKTKEPTEIFVPAGLYAENPNATVEPEGSGMKLRLLPGEPKNGVLVIAPTGEVIERRLVLKPKGE
ncbi:MAG: glycoside hydrolase family 5 protein [bacterium]|nr:glycoside hydrolase family 5 protein [bacterium]